MKKKERKEARHLANEIDILSNNAAPDLSDKDYAALQVAVKVLYALSACSMVR